MPDAIRPFATARTSDANWRAVTGTHLPSTSRSNGTNSGDSFSWRKTLSAIDVFSGIENDCGTAISLTVTPPSLDTVGVHCITCRWEMHYPSDRFALFLQSDKQ